jgi:hypothetical protein
MKPKSNLVLIGRAAIAMTALSIWMLLAGCSSSKKETEDTVDPRLKAMTDEVSARDSMLDELLTTFDQVEANLALIREKEESLQDWAEGEEVMGNRNDRMVHDIKVINSLMADNRDEISRLRISLRNSGVNIKSLETRLNHMELENQATLAELTSFKTKLAEAETALAGLNDTLTDRQLRVAMQQEVISAQSHVISEQDAEIHEAYIATGTYKELKSRGLVDKKGALLGIIGGEKEFTAKTDPSEFVAIDQREQMRIPIYGKKVELITPHPAGSYEVETTEDGKVSMIDIVHPEDFWKSSRYLIVATD